MKVELEDHEELKLNSVQAIRTRFETDVVVTPIKRPACVYDDENSGSEYVPHAQAGAEGGHA